MSRSLTLRRADFVDVLEAAYFAETDERRWAEQLTASVKKLFTASPEFALMLASHADDYANASVTLIGESSDFVAKVLPEIPPQYFRETELFRDAWYPGRPAITHSELQARLLPQHGAQFKTYRSMMSAPDILGLFAYPAPGLVLLLCGTLDEVSSLSPAEQAQFEKISAHLDSAWRLRHQPAGAIDAVLSPEGELLDLAPSLEGEDATELASQIRAIEHSRLRAERCEPDAIERWQALIGGRYTVVPREDTDGKRFYFLVLNSPPAQTHACFSQGESDVVRLAARGLTSKGIAYGLGISQSSVSERLASAAAKIGLRSRAELVHIAASMFGKRVEPSELRALTPAELEVFELMRRGMSNGEIAEARGRSPHTVANQIASILLKLRAPSRRAISPVGED